MNFALTRPYLYHLTARSNLKRIRETKTLFPAAALMERAGRADLIRLRRRSHERLNIDGQAILLRDQAPLRRGNLMLPSGYQFEDFIENLNGRVFFWPGTAARPIESGIRHFERYREEQPLILRVDYRSLIDDNSDINPEFCRYNSGSPRCSHGKKIPRGPNTFVTEPDFEGTASQVVEVTFGSEVDLPLNTLFGKNPKGPWHSLFPTT